MADMIKVRSASDSIIVINAPEIPLVKTWSKRNAVYPIAKDALIQAFYSTSLEALIKEGMLIVEDAGFLMEVGLIQDVKEQVAVELTPALMKKAIGVIPTWEFKDLLDKLSEHQISDLAEYAIANHGELRMDRIDMLSKASHKNILKAIELYRKAQED